MKVECPLKDWEGDSAFLALHLKEMHKIDAAPEKGSLTNPLTIPSKLTFSQWLMKHPLYVSHAAAFVLGWILAVLYT